MSRFLLALLLLSPSLASALSYPATILADTPRHYYHLDETSGTSAADVGNGGGLTINWTYTGGFTLNQAGIPGYPGNGAVKLNGSTGYVVGNNNQDFVYSPANNAGWSVEVWAFPTVAANAALTANATSAHFDYQLAILSGGTFSAISFQDNGAGSCLGANGGVTGAVGSYSINHWYHVVLTTLGSGGSLTNMKLYVNATLLSTVTSFPGNLCQQHTEADAGRRGDNAIYFTGTLDELAFYGDGASSAGQLSQSQVTAHYLAGSIAPATSWPYTVRLPGLPRFRDGIFWSRYVDGGYNTGLFDMKAHTPQFFVPAFVSFEVMPDGHGQ